MLAGVILMLRTVTLTEQGLFFVFVSFGALLQVSEFGLSYAAMQTTAFLSASGNFPEMARLVKRARQLNARFLACGALLIGTYGAYVISDGAGQSLSLAKWLGPWGLFVGSVFLAQVLALEISLVEGIRSAALAWRFRFLQELVAGLAFIGAISAGLGLWSLGVFWCTRFATAALWLRHIQEPLPSEGHDDANTLLWRHAVWPFQWRVGVSALSGFLIFQAMTPIVFLQIGAEAAGRFGLSLAVMNTMLLITSAWPLSQARRFGRLLAEREFSVLRRSFWRMTTASTLMAALVCGTTAVVLVWLSAKAPNFAGRLADVSSNVALLATAVVHHVTACFGVLFRSERRDPLLSVTVVGSLLTALVIWLLSATAELSVVANGVLGCALLGLPVVLLIYRSASARWSAVQSQRIPGHGSP
jgi:hypothetical protein